LSDDESILILTLDYDFLVPSAPHPMASVLAQESDCTAIDSNFALLDSQSTVDLFTNPSLVTDICPAMSPIRVHCNKGMLDTTEEANFGDTPVYFDARGIANVLSLYRLGQKFRVTYDSPDHGGVFKVHTSQGIVEFSPTAKGLHALNLRDNPTAAYMLVNNTTLTSDHTPQDHYLHVENVRDNYDGFTKKQIERAIAARRLMGMIASPLECDFQGLVRLNLLKDCPITNADITNARQIFGPDLANIRDKTVQKNLSESEQIMLRFLVPS
jgi:hypothetical protein